MFPNLFQDWNIIGNFPNVLNICYKKHVNNNLANAQRFFNEWKELGKKHKELQAELVHQTIAAALGKPGDTADVVMTGADFGTLVKAVGSFKKEFKGRTIIFRGDNLAYGYSDLINVKEKLAEAYMNMDGNEHEAKAFKAKA